MQGMHVSHARLPRPPYNIVTCIGSPPYSHTAMQPSIDLPLLILLLLGIGAAAAAAQVPGCACTPLGVSGGVFVGGRVGCAAHLAALGDSSIFWSACAASLNRRCLASCRTLKAPSRAFRAAMSWTLRPAPLAA
jgi:hypothetical protein